MTYLIDTHMLIWYISGNKKLKRNTISTIGNTSNIIYVSKATLWEMAIKISLRKLELSILFEELEIYLEENEFVILDYDFNHLKTLLDLPFYHGDPFDRLIIAQAVADDLTVITHDKRFDSYPVKIQR